MDVLYWHLKLIPSSHTHPIRYCYRHMCLCSGHMTIRNVSSLDSELPSLLVTYIDHSNFLLGFIYIYLIECHCTISLNTSVCFVVRGESPGCRLISTASMLEWLRNLLHHHSQGSSMERWSRNTLRVVTARVFYILRVFLKVPLYFK